jgi:hypothetical protein
MAARMLLIRKSPQIRIVDRGCPSAIPLPNGGVDMLA